MTRKLMIVESPSKINSLSRYLRQFTFEASVGHVQGLPSKAGSVDTEDNFKMHYEIKSPSIVKKILASAKKADEIYLATDPDREGEAIAWHIQMLVQEKLPDKAFKRVSFQSITRDSVEESVKNPREIDMNLVDSQQTRRTLDYLVGFSISPLLWSRIPSTKSAGRVQSIALRMVCEREKEVLEFEKQEYWEIKAKFQGVEVMADLTSLEGKKLKKTTFKKDKKGKEAKTTQYVLCNEKKAMEAKSVVEAENEYKVISIDKTTQERRPQSPFKTSTLQQAAASKLGFTPKKTMKVAQDLYEGGLITYMRTDSTFIAKPFVQETRKYIEKEWGKKYVASTVRTYSSKGSQEAHEAIRITSLKKSEELPLTPDQAKLRDLIWRRTLASQMSPHIREICRVICQAGGAELQLTNSVVLFPGFRKVYPVDKKEEDNLIQLEKGQILKLEKAEACVHFTKPPARYNAASLIKALDEKGIGRPSTYAPIISALEDRGYCTLGNGKELRPQGHSWALVLFLEECFRDLMQYEFTEKMEKTLDKIAQGQADRISILQKFWDQLKPLIKKAEGLRTASIIDSLDPKLPLCLFPEKSRNCPECTDGRLGLKIGKSGSFIGCCAHPNCSYTSTIGVKRKLEGKWEHSKGGTICVKSGPYGPYVQWDQENGEVKRASIERNQEDNLTQEEAEKLLTLPRDLGEDPKTGSRVLAARGKYGPYVCLLTEEGGKKSDFANIKSDDDDKVYTIELDEALELIEKRKATKGRR